MSLYEELHDAKFGVFIVVKEAEGRYRIDITGASETGMRYTAEFAAEDFEKYRMGAKPETEWPPEKVDGYYRCKGGIGYGGYDSFRVFNPSWVRMVLRGGPSYFNAYYSDETVEPPRRSLWRAVSLTSTHGMRHRLGKAPPLVRELEQPSATARPRTGRPSLVPVLEHSSAGSSRSSQSGGSMSTQERLEKAVREEPRRWIPTRDENGELTRVLDADSSRLWVRTKEGWMYVE